ncbi:MAG: hypothetical protein RL616_679 [Verrucomicrobiota bacterium]
MKLWIGGELDADVADSFRIASNRVEDAINHVILQKSYDLPVTGWDCIAIIRADAEFPERIRYSKKTREMDFRLCIDHAKFKAANSNEQELMLFVMLRRSLELLVQRLPSTLQLDELHTDLKAAEATL